MFTNIGGEKMSKEKEKLFKKLSDAVVNMDEEETVLLSKKWL